MNTRDKGLGIAALIGLGVSALAVLGYKKLPKDKKDKIKIRQYWRELSPSTNMTILHEKIDILEKIIDDKLIYKGII